MGGRSGQTLGGLSVSVTGAPLSKSWMSRYATNEGRKLGITGSVSISYNEKSQQVGGGVDFVDAGNGVYKIGNKIEVRGRGLSDNEIKAVLRHELTHIKQSQRGEFYFKGGFYYWKGEKQVSAATYSKYIKEMYSPDQEKRLKAYAKYRDLPWEKEAHKAGDIFKN